MIILYILNKKTNIIYKSKIEKNENQKILERNIGTCT